MTASADHALLLLADLGEASARAHTEATLVPAVSAALSRHLPLLRLDLRRGAAAPGAPEVRRGAGGETIAVFALRDAEGAVGCATMALGGGAALDVSPALLEATGRLLAVALRQVQVLGRVAAIARRAQGEKRTLKEELDRVALPREVVAVGPAMRAIFQQMVPLVARQDTTVLVRGETGTGKEVIARRIHALSRRAERPFLAVNCGALPEGLVESALFGHERGAFTGAAARHLGLFERASGGTLLLDEVGELPRAAQAKLLRVLQEGEIERVGGEGAVRVSVRVIAATHRPLEDMVASGAFREDLYYRLQVFPIIVPPLRERPEDLEPLTRVIVEKVAASFGRTPPRVSAESMARLRAHGWPGNVRELENVIERSMVMSTGDELILSAPLSAAPGAPGATGRVMTYREAAQRCIEDALRAAGGKIYGEDGAAAALGLKPTTLQSKMRKLGIRKDGEKG
ncbi:sigma 54-interacting transcriptional regulator [Sorangium sp. So ce295]|jgi:transcriptional regulator with GAF, ATPase, and Fis domain|uniref:sigma-54 interaction domain-containing protein n=1 Tax=Sorangium sp. So ce295 TaxID=3133295 RepID=UPI003F638A1F